MIGFLHSDLETLASAMHLDFSVFGDSALVSTMNQACNF